MVAGPDTFIHAVLEWCGYENLAIHLPKEILASQRYPKLTIEDIRRLKPDVLLLSSEPYPFSKEDQIDLAEFKSELVNGEIFSWYGVRMKELKNLCFSKNI
jgi:ABC-type Fe3+-hydroxamate transport system substrate-binding protein